MSAGVRSSRFSTTPEETKRWRLHFRTRCALPRPRLLAKLTQLLVQTAQLDILRKLNHGNLVRFFAACTKPPPDGQLGILMELMDGSLASLLYGKASTGPSGKRHEMCVHP